MLAFEILLFLIHMWSLRVYKCQIINFACGLDDYILNYAVTTCSISIFMSSFITF
jgi:hypothetical protein